MLACPHCISTVVVAIVASGGAVGGAVWAAIRFGVVGNFFKKFRKK